MRRDKNFRPDPNLNPYKIKESPSSARRTFIDFNTQRVCPACGKAIKISHNFCKYCGVDLSAIEPIGNSDEISKQLAITAVTDPDAEVRKEAVDTLGDFGETNVLGVLTFVLLNDPDENVILNYSLILTLSNRNNMLYVLIRKATDLVIFLKVSKLRKGN